MSRPSVTANVSVAWKFVAVITETVFEQKCFLSVWNPLQEFYHEIHFLQHCATVLNNHSDRVGAIYACAFY